MDSYIEWIDIYFDNMGGKCYKQLVAIMNMVRRVAVCGVTSKYTNTRKRAVPDMMGVVYKRITIQ